MDKLGPIRGITVHQVDGLRGIYLLSHPEPFVPVLVPPEPIDTRALMRRASAELALAYACQPGRVAMVKSAPDIQDIFPPAFARYVDEVLAAEAWKTWHRRLRANRTRNRRR